MAFVCCDGCSLLLLVEECYCRSAEQKTVFVVEMRVLRRRQCAWHFHKRTECCTVSSTVFCYISRCRKMTFNGYCKEFSTMKYCLFSKNLKVIGGTCKRGERLGDTKRYLGEVRHRVNSHVASRFSSFQVMLAAQSRPFRLEKAIKQKQQMWVCTNCPGSTCHSCAVVFQDLDEAIEHVRKRHRNSISRPAALGDSDSHGQRPYFGAMAQNQLSLMIPHYRQ